MDFVAGRKRVPYPAAGNRHFLIIIYLANCLLFVLVVAKQVESIDLPCNFADVSKTQYNHIISLLKLLKMGKNRGIEDSLKLSNPEFIDNHANNIVCYFCVVRTKLLSIFR